jgi:hypothetical protein
MRFCSEFELAVAQALTGLSFLAAVFSPTIRAGSPIRKVIRASAQRLSKIAQNQLT